MCGIAGIFDQKITFSQDEMCRLAKSLGDRLSHRGPDAAGEWVDANVGIALAHRRLSIIDLSPAGHQPMKSQSGRFVIAYNGEIYNFRDLREELESTGLIFKGESDTEVLLEAISTWGFDRTLPRLIGMFAIAVWDMKERSLTLVRDRLGIKPLYWGRQSNRFYFASELKSLFADSLFTPELNRAALSGLVALNYVSGKQSIYQGIQQLEPGCTLKVAADGKIETQRYWDVAKIAAHACRNKQVLDEKELEESTHALVKDAVNKRMISDVPIGVFLSGGIDSSVVAVLMQENAPAPVNTLTIGFEAQNFDESSFAKAIADHLGTNHSELTIENSQAIEAIPKLAETYCEPFADSSQIPTYLVSALARQHVTVALSGDGGDEVFAGYNRYVAAQKHWPHIARIPFPLRSIMSKAVYAVPDATLDAFGGRLTNNKRLGQFSNSLKKYAGLMASKSPDQFYEGVVRFWENVDEVVIGGQNRVEIENRWSEADGLEDPMERMQLRDMLTYLPGDILTKVDRASMSVGLETRVPLLDHRVVEHMWSVPVQMKIRQGQSKWLLRRLLQKHIPDHLLDRPKMGFAVPLGDWLRGPLRDWAESLLSESSLKSTGLFHPTPVREMWQRHLVGEINGHYALWSILSAQAWYERWMTGRTVDN